MAGNRTSSLGKRGYRKRGPKSKNGARRWDKTEYEQQGIPQEFRRYKDRYS